MSQSRSWSNNLSQNPKSGHHINQTFGDFRQSFDPYNSSLNAPDHQPAAPSQDSMTNHFQNRSASFIHEYPKAMQLHLNKNLKAPNSGTPSEVSASLKDRGNFEAYQDKLAGRDDDQKE